MNMKEARWNYANADTIRDDIKNTMLNFTRNVMRNTAACNEIKLAMLDGAWELYSALIPFTEEQKDEDIQNA